MKKVIGALFVLLGCAVHAFAADANDYFGRRRISAIAGYAKVVAVIDVKAKGKIGGYLVLARPVESGTRGNLHCVGSGRLPRQFQ